MATKTPQYSLEDFDQYHVLKIPLLLWLSTFYLLKYPLLYALPAVPAMGSAEYLTKFVIAHFHWSLLVFSCLPAALVLVAMMRRRPTAGAAVRRIWTYGRGLLLLAVVADLSIQAALIVGQQQKLSEYVLVIGYLDVMLWLYLWRSRRVREVFKQFPASEAELTSPTAKEQSNGS